MFVDCLEDSDFLSAHGGIFRSLNWTNDELAEISALHTAASHHKLMKLMTQKMSESDVEFRTRQQIEKFMLDRVPPRFLEKFLSEEDRSTLLRHHATGNFHQYAVLMFKRLFELSKHQVILALRYFGHTEEAKYIEEAECYKCAMGRLSKRLVR
ncbi:hypothetical protein KIN20_025973 [Parelaphostrongylus tenuis]|uniref:Uncharacterized protein n=1 Tax=Parelaphostrongylus tenuis TaxID=148309 RepID=A0AAD5NDJ9_PARTN|nr:hypothetical protein KIN20_025973 [Parelaphostrongylus tenuis]